MKFMSIFWSTAPIAHISLITKIKSPDKLRLRRKKAASLWLATLM